MRTVRVTPELIARGLPYLCSRCPVALALSVAFPEADEWNCGPLTLLVMKDEQIVHQFETPEHVRQWMVAFDLRRNPQPFEFELPDNNQPDRP